MHVSAFLSAALTVGVVYAASVPQSLVVHEKRGSSPPQWIKLSRAPQEKVIPVQLVFALQNIEQGHDHLMQISDPGSPNFGKHWSAEQVHDFFAPPRETILAVREWLTASGISMSRHQLAVNQGHLRFEASVSEIELIFGTRYDIWQHSKTGAMSISCDQYHLPDRIKHAVDFVSPGVVLHNFRPSTSKRRKAQLGKFARKRRAIESIATFNASQCLYSVTPACIKALYNISAPTKAYEGNDLGLYESQDIYDQVDENNFFTAESPNIPNGTHPTLKSIDGGSAPRNSTAGGGESNLDLNCAYPIIYPQQIQLFQTYNLSTALSTKGLFNDFLNALDASYCTYEGGDDPEYDPHLGYTPACGIYKPTNVISISYEDSESNYSPSYVQRQCHEFMKLGLQGTSVIFASGDNGTITMDGCLPNAAQNPPYPATCPYVTTVGATQITTDPSAPNHEIAPNAEDFGGIVDFTSGGGFSNVFPRPQYQANAVAHFLNSSSQLPPSDTYNQSGRAFPDVAAIGYDVVSWDYGQQETPYGTSAAAPIFAAIITRINGERIENGKKPLGFLNPSLYANPQMFNDIVSGSNLGCNAQPAFYCQEGWDPVTGLGTPKFEKMVEVLGSLP